MWANVAAAVVGAHLANKGAKKQNIANEAASVRQMEFQERMSNTAYQRGMQDMQKAGLNPILASKVGGASTPSGASFQAVNTKLAAVNAAANAYNVMANTAKTEQETEILKRTGGSPIPKTFEGFKRLLQSYKDSGISSIKQKLQQAIDSNNAEKAKKALESNSNKMLRIRITPNRRTN